MDKLPLSKKQICVGRPAATANGPVVHSFECALGTEQKFTSPLIRGIKEKNKSFLCTQRSIRWRIGGIRNKLSAEWRDRAIVSELNGCVSCCAFVCRVNL